MSEIRLPANHAQVQLLVRRYAFCCYRYAMSRGGVATMTWGRAADVLQGAISRLIGTKNWQVPYPPARARMALREKWDATPVVLNAKIVVTKQFRRVRGKWDDGTVVIIFDETIMQTEIASILAELPRNVACRLKVEIDSDVSYRWPDDKQDRASRVLNTFGPNDFSEW